eukprot:15692628-Heterocapsa_arctica.AAC.1
MLRGRPSGRGARRPQDAQQSHPHGCGLVGGNGHGHGMAKGHQWLRGAMDRSDHPCRQRPQARGLAGVAG